MAAMVAARARALAASRSGPFSISFCAIRPPYKKYVPSASPPSASTAQQPRE